MNTRIDPPANRNSTAAVTVTPGFDTHAHHRRFSWGAIAAGMVIAIVVQLVLSLLGTGIGTIDPLRYSSPDASTFGLGAGIWWIVSSVISLFAGGWVAGHLANSPDRTDALLHGLLTWGVATIVTVYLLASVVGSVARGGASLLGKAAGAAAAGASAVAGPATDLAKRQLDASGVDLDTVKNQVQQLLAQTGKPGLQAGAIAGQASAAAGQLTDAAASAGSTGGSAADDLQGALQKIISSGKSTVDQADRESIVNVMMSRTGASRPEAEQRVDGWIKSYQDTRAKIDQQAAAAEAKARQAADDAASASSKAAFGGFVALVLGAIAAALGGSMASRPVLVSREVPASTAYRA